MIVRITFDITEGRQRRASTCRNWCQGYLLPTGSKEREVLGVGSRPIPFAILPSRIIIEYNCIYLGSKNNKHLRGSAQATIHPSVIILTVVLRALVSLTAMGSIVTLILPPLYFLYYNCPPEVRREKYWGWEYTFGNTSLLSRDNNFCIIFAQK